MVVWFEVLAASEMPGPGDSGRLWRLEDFFDASNKNGRKTLNQTSLTFKCFKACGFICNLHHFVLKIYNYIYIYVKLYPTFLLHFFERSYS